MSYLYLKALHIIFVVTWFAGLFYIVRLFIYHTEAFERPKNEQEILINQFQTMEKRLWYGITWPSCILTLVFGSSLLHHWLPLSSNPWLISKLAMVVLLFLYHLLCGSILKKLKEGRSPYSSMQLRILNEVSTIFLVGIVFLVSLKNLMSMIYGIIGLIIFSIILMIAIKVYRNIRVKNEK